jgi:hypothetical protein
MGTDYLDHAWDEVLAERLAEEEDEIREYANDLLAGREPILDRSAVQRMLKEKGAFYGTGIRALVKQAEQIHAKRHQGSHPGVQARQKKADKDRERIQVIIEKHGIDISLATIEGVWRADYPDLKPPSISKISRIRSELKNM